MNRHTSNDELNLKSNPFRIQTPKLSNKYLFTITENYPFGAGNYVHKTLKEKGGIMKDHSSPYIDRKRISIEFSVKNDFASQISLSGTFNNWAQDQLNLKPSKDGTWKIKIPMLPRGKYSYKFFVDDRMWMEDIENPYREPDGVIGFNSILLVEN